MNIIHCIEDKNLLGQFIKDPSTWAAWLCFLRAFYALPPAKGDVELYQRCTGRSTWPSEPSKEAWLVIGTRGGKSFVTGLLATFIAAFQEHRLSPGETGYVLVVAPTKKQSGIVKRYVGGFFAGNAFLRPLVAKETTEDLELKNNVTISTMPNDYRSLRGFTAVAAIVDEVAFLSIEGQLPDVEVIRALRSRLTSTGGPLICISSPYAKRGELYKTWRRHYGRDGSPVLVWQASSMTMNPTLDRDAIARAHEEDPEGARADYDAEFRSDIESFVSREIVDGLVVPGRRELPPIAGVTYKGFVDPSGGSKDAMTLGIAHAEQGRRVLDVLLERRPPFSPDDVVQEFAGTLKQYGVLMVTGDRYGGEWPRERFQAHGITYQMAEKPKSDLYRELLPLLNSGQVELLDSERMTAELVGLERRTGRGGKDSIDHGPHGHDDLINAACGALLLCQAPAGISDLWAGPEIQTSEQYPLLGDRALWNLD